ncbi:MAG: hypothetical protein ACOYMH_11880 [Zwartia sp.]|jgi:amino acid permease
MIEVLQNQYRLPYRLLRLLAVLMAVAIFLQALGCLAAYLLMLDSQAAGMMAHLLMQQLSYYLLGCTFVILSLANVLIKRGVSQLKAIRLPALILTVSVAVASFLLIPRMDYLRDTALDAGMPVMLSPFANYFVALNSIAFLLLCAQIVSGTLIAWRLSNTPST